MSRTRQVVVLVVLAVAAILTAPTLLSPSLPSSAARTVATDAPLPPSVGPLRFTIVDSVTPCPPDIPAAAVSTTFTTRQSICITGLAEDDYELSTALGFQPRLTPTTTTTTSTTTPTTNTTPPITGTVPATNGSEDPTDGADATPVPDRNRIFRLGLMDGFEWSADNLPELLVTIASRSTPSVKQTLQVRPDVSVVVEFTAPAGSPAATTTTLAPTPTTTSVTTTTIATVTTADGSEPPETDGTGAPPNPATTVPSALPTLSDPVDDEAIVVGRRATTKTIRIAGDDAAIVGVEGVGIVETFSTDGVVASIEGAAIDIADGSFALPLNGRSEFSYQLQSDPAQYFVTRPLELTTQLTFSDRPIASSTSTVTLRTPDISVSVDAPPEVTTTNADITVTVTSSDTIAQPFVLRLRPEQGGSLIRVFSDTDDGSVEQNTVTWAFDEGLTKDEPESRTVRVTFAEASSNQRLTWSAAILDADGVEVDNGTATSEVTAAASPVGDPVSVDFTPGQLIRLIAFVMALALIAIIFGAWRRSRAATERDIDLFKAFSESILVLVIIVAILVLALRGSLNGESAASLIGVIAGYALGGARGRAK